MSDTLNPRLTPARPDVAAAFLKGRVEALRFSEGDKRRVAVGHAGLRRAPRPDAPLETELLFGEEVAVYDELEGWAWAQAATSSANVAGMVHAPLMHGVMSPDRYQLS